MSTYSPEPVGGNWNFDPEYHRIAGLLGLDPVKRQSYRMAEKIAFIVKVLGGKSLTDKLSRLERARKSLGTNEMGELLVNNLWQSMRLKADMRLEGEQRKIALQEEEERKKKEAEEKAVKIEKSAQDLVRDLQKKIEGEKARVDELLKTNGSEYAEQAK